MLSPSGNTERLVRLLHEDASHEIKTGIQRVSVTAKDHVGNIIGFRWSFKLFKMNMVMAEFFSELGVHSKLWLDTAPHVPGPYAVEKILPGLLPFVAGGVVPLEAISTLVPAKICEWARSTESQTFGVICTPTVQGCARLDEFLYARRQINLERYRKELCYLVFSVILTFLNAQKVHPSWRHYDGIPENLLCSSRTSMDNLNGPKFSAEQDVVTLVVLNADLVATEVRVIKPRDLEVKIIDFSLSVISGVPSPHTSSQWNYACYGIASPLDVRANQKYDIHLFLNHLYQMITLPSLVRTQPEEQLRAFIERYLPEKYRGAGVTLHSPHNVFLSPREMSECHLVDSRLSSFSISCSQANSVCPRNWNVRSHLLSSVYYDAQVKNVEGLRFKVPKMLLPSGAVSHCDHQPSDLRFESILSDPFFSVLFP